MRSPVYAAFIFVQMVLLGTNILVKGQWVMEWFESDQGVTKIHISGKVRSTDERREVF